MALRHNSPADDGEGLLRLAAEHLEANRPEAALRCLRAALARGADDANLQRLAGHLLFGMRRLEEALAAHERAMALGIPGSAVAEERWMANMLLGRFDVAWRISDQVLAARDRNGRNSPALPPHRRWVWDGRPLAGRSVLVRCYHGLGDSLQFVRYLPQLRRVARDVTLQAPPELSELLLASGLGPVVPLHAGEPPHDADIECMELPHAFRTLPETVPGETPYLQVPQALRQAVAGRLGGGGGLRVGLVWAAGDWDSRRSLPLEGLAPLAALSGIEWVALQCGPAVAEAAGGPFAFHPVRPSGDSVMETAAIVANLDLVIAADTMVAHLAGALGVPVWTLLHFAADWRWMLRDRTPWYPTMRLFRQPRPGHWKQPVAEVAAALWRRTGRWRAAG